MGVRDLPKTNSMRLFVFQVARVFSVFGWKRAPLGRIWCYQFYLASSKIIFVGYPTNVCRLMGWFLEVQEAVRNSCFRTLRNNLIQ